MINKINKIILILLVSAISLFSIVNLMATPCSANNLNSWKTVLDEGAGTSGAGYDTQVDSPERFIPIVIKMLLSFLGVLFLVLMIYGGFLWMTARGNEEQVTKAKNLITAAIIGLIIVLASYAISIFVMKSLASNALSF